MGLRAGVETDVERVALLYKSYFKMHTLFEQPLDEIALYVKEQLKKHTLLVHDEAGMITAAVMLVTKNTHGTHKLWMLRHFAFTRADFGEELLKEAERQVREGSKTAKVELRIAESEEGINFFRMQGYEQEGCLRNHYRWGERCYVLSKSFS